MKKILAAVVLIVAIGGFAYWSSTKMSASPVVSTEPTTASSDYTGTSGDTSSNSATAALPTGTTSGQYKDGTYTGPVEDAFYGNLQVSATISGGKLVEVTFLQVPDAPGNTQAVNAKSSPLLKSEAIAAQSAKVDIVSGATQSSEAFQQSLGGALSQAQS